MKQLHTANLNKWGNLAPMNKDNNSAIKDLSFHKKNIHPKGYQASNSKIMKNIPKDTRIDTDSTSQTHGQEIPVFHAQHDSTKTPEDTWDFESINERTETLCQKAREDL